MDTPVILTAAVESALNGYLHLDPDALARSAALQGRVIGLEVSGLGLRLFFLPGAEGIQVMGRYEGEPDTLLRGTPLALARLGLAGDSGAQMLASEIRIEGDTDLGQTFNELLSSVDIDWEEWLSQAVGDIAAHQIGNSLRGARRWAQRAGTSLRLDTTEYLQEEAGHLPTRVEVERFLDDIDTYRSDVDRLEARIQRLEAQREKGQG